MQIIGCEMEKLSWQIYLPEFIHHNDYTIGRRKWREFDDEQVLGNCIEYISSTKYAQDFRQLNCVWRMLCKYEKKKKRFYFEFVQRKMSESVRNYVRITLKYSLFIWNSSNFQHSFTYKTRISFDFNLLLCQ